MFMPYANNKDADQSTHSRSLVNAFIIRCLYSITISKIPRHVVVSVAQQVGRPGLKPPKAGFSRNVTHLVKLMRL